MEQQLHFNIFMQDPNSDESKEYFSMQRKAILTTMREAARTVVTQDEEKTAESQDTYVFTTENDSSTDNNCFDIQASSLV